MTRAARREPPGGIRGQAGAASRPLLWLVAGLALLGLLSVAVAPELLAVPGRVTQLLVVVLLAGVPGLALLAALIPRRRRLDGLVDRRSVEGADPDDRTSPRGADKEA